MRNVRKQMAGLGAVVLALVVAAGACQASVIANLSLAVDTGAKEWAVYATLTDSSSETLGLHGVFIDVWGSPAEYGPWTGDLKVVGPDPENPGEMIPLGLIVLPKGTCPTYGWGIGFSEQQQAGVVVGTGIELMGAMQRNAHQARTVSSVLYNSILKGVGETAGSAPPGLTWDHPVLVAEGTYTGDAGWLNVSLRKNVGGTVTSMTVLPATLPAATSTGAAFATFSPTAGDNYRASFNVPEPATLALLGLGGLGLVLGRKRK